MNHLPAFLQIVIIWGVLIPFVATFLSTGTVFWLYSRPMRRQAGGVHWSVTARSFCHVRNARGLASIGIFTTIFLSCYNDLASEGNLWLLVPIMLSAIVGCSLGFREAARGLKLPDTVKRGGLRSTVTLMILFPALPSMFAIIALTWTRGLSIESIGIVAGVLLIDVVLTMGGSVTLLRTLRLLRPADDSIQRLSRDLAAAQGVPLRHVMRLDLPTANAFAFFWTKDLAFTGAALTELTHDELASIVSHELGHLREGLLTRWTRLAGLLPIGAIGLAPAAMHDDRPGIVLALFAVYFIIARYSTAFYKRMETSADHHAHHAESEEGVYARALEKIHAASLMPAVLHPRNPYPSLYDRMTGAGVTPDFPRPAPPARVTPLLCGLAATILFIPLWHGLRHLAPDLIPQPALHEDAAE